MTKADAKEVVRFECLREWNDPEERRRAYFDVDDEVALLSRVL